MMVVFSSLAFVIVSNTSTMAVSLAELVAVVRMLGNCHELDGVVAHPWENNPASTGSLKTLPSKMTPRLVFLGY